MDKYYVRDESQIHLQQQLLDAVRAHIASNGTLSLYDDNSAGDSGDMEDSLSPQHRPLPSNVYMSPLEHFAFLTAGQPVLYGVCLQKQHLDPNHSPQRLRVRNGHRPFLYR